MNVGNHQHKNVVSDQFCVGTTWPSRPKVPTFGCRANMSPTCRQHCQPRNKRTPLSEKQKEKSDEVFVDGVGCRLRQQHYRQHATTTKVTTMRLMLDVDSLDNQEAASIMPAVGGSQFW